MTDPRDVLPDIRVYQVYTVVDEAGTWHHCPICGLLTGVMLRGHGPEHFIEDAST